LAVGVVPFAGAIVAAVLFLRTSRRGAPVAFASVSISVTVWLLLEVAFHAALFDNTTGQFPRIHERFLIYVVPLFLIALFSTLSRTSAASTRVYLAAGASAALLLLVIPFHTVVNGTTIVDTFSLQPFAVPRDGELGVVSHGRLVAVLAAGVLALLYVLAR